MTVKKWYKFDQDAQRGRWEIRGEMDGLVFVVNEETGWTVHCTKDDFVEMWRESEMDVVMTTEELASERRAAREAKREIEAE